MLQERAAAEALDGNDAEATILRRLERAEATKACFGLLRKHLKPTSSGGLTKAQVAAPTQMALIFSEMSRNPKKCSPLSWSDFGQANGTLSLKLHSRTGLAPTAKLTQDKRSSTASCDQC
jgi:hypothetical protein